MKPRGKDIQVDNGEFTRVHNSILEVLSKLQVSSLELRIVLFILRKTYGFGKKTDVISLSQFESCGSDRRRIFDAIKKLIQLNIITRKKKGLQTYEYGFNKYIEQWSPECFQPRRAGNGKNFKNKTVDVNDTSDSIDTSDVNDIGTVDVNDNGTSDVNDTHKRKKETIKENIKQIPISEQSNQQLFFGKVAEICAVDMKLKRGHIAKTVQRLKAAEYSLIDLENFNTWWYLNDFRGKNGDPPTLGQLEEKIYQSKLGRKNGKGKHTIYDNPPQPSAEEIRKALKGE